MRISDWFKLNNSRDARFLGEVVFGHCWYRDDRVLHAEEVIALEDKIRRLNEGEPLAYVAGFVPFYECHIKVNPTVLIPRPATEQMVDEICNAHSQRQARVLDLCTGSGCIAVALKKHRPHWQVWGIDKSMAAISTAKENAHLNGVVVDFRIWDITKAAPTILCHPWDLIIANPPYVSQEDYLVEPKLRYEPIDALVPPEEEYALYWPVLDFASQWLNQGGSCWLEHGSMQKKKLIKMLNSFGLRLRTCYADYQGHDRMMSCTIA